MVMEGCYRFKLIVLMCRYNDKQYILLDFNLLTTLCEHWDNDYIKSSKQFKNKMLGAVLHKVHFKIVFSLIILTLKLIIFKLDIIYYLI